MKKSGLADSPFFSMPKQVKSVPAPLSDQPLTEKGQGKRLVNVKSSQSAKQPIDRDTTKPRNHETTVSRYHDTIIELIRTAVKDCGKEAATYRFSVDEKKALAGIIYSYKGQGIRTSENQIARIAVNSIVNDYRENGENSILDRVLRALKG